ncbi:MAG TPA: cytochrome b/b6 domain-containing protein [Nitrospiria bacterium]|nr:cytochrome b/b6 domain-containing protein [Nitrospiria bacterium]
MKSRMEEEPEPIETPPTSEKSERADGEPPPIYPEDQAEPAPLPIKAEPPPVEGRKAPPFRWIYRHPLPVRLAHWINVLSLPILIMSGFQIFSAHPALYICERSDRDRPILSIKARLTDDGTPKGITTLLGHPFDTTGLLGASKDASGRIRSRTFPAWATLPSNRWLAMGRRWHFFFAWVFVLNGLLFGLYALWSRHLSRDLFPRWRELRGIGRSILDHLLFRHPKGEEAARYNVLQKIAYSGVVFGFGPLIVLTGLTMSPSMDAAFPFLLTLFGGRQSARTIHFIVCFAFIGYTAFHLVMVTVTGLWNNLRSMLAGWYRIME